MQKACKKSSFNPYHRYENARGRILYKDANPSTDIWENKIYNILWLRERFKETYKNNYLRHFEKQYPLYASLIEAFEDCRIGGDRDALEAIMLCGVDLAKTADVLKHPRFDSMFLCAYRKLFYDITPVLCNPLSIFQYVIAPMVSADTDSLAVGHIWKALALSGGAGLLKRKGFGTEAVKADDISYLLQLACYRHCSSLLQYSAAGTKFFKDNPAAGAALTTLTEFDAVRGNGRRPDYLAELGELAKNNFNCLLSGELKLLSVPEDEVKKLAELDGKFSPQLTDLIEYNKHVVFSDNEDAND